MRMLFVAPRLTFRRVRAASLPRVVRSVAVSSQFSTTKIRSHLNGSERRRPERVGCEGSV